MIKEFLHVRCRRSLFRMMLILALGLSGCSPDEECLGTGCRIIPVSEARASSDGGLPVFPGAEGFGTHTRAGRGGKIIAVTTLADSGPGSLRAALEHNGPRIVVFRVGGVIELRELLFIRHPFVTVAGQTAPGDGIVLKNFGLIIMTNDVLVQHIRVRPGNEGDIDPTGNDALQIFGPHGDVAGAYNVVVDHVSGSWGEDETFSTWFGPRDITISWCIISEALSRSRHPKRSHSAGLLIGDGSDRVSIHHNLLAHNDFRNPLFISGGRHDFVNNVIYNWRDIATEIINDAPITELNIVGNYYIPGPSMKNRFEVLLNWSASNPPYVFMKDNVTPSIAEDIGNDWKLYYRWEGQIASRKYRSKKRFSAPTITTADSVSNLQDVLAGAGATAPARDTVDRRIVEEVKNRKGRIIDSPADVGGFPIYNAGKAPRDSDGDGMPDRWEEEVGLNSRNPSDAHGDRNGDGYTNIEEYLHALTSARSG